MIPSASNVQLLSSSFATPVAVVAPSPTPRPSSDWVVSDAERARFLPIFESCDSDRDGLVNGNEVYDTFLQSGVPQSFLAQIWRLCDTFERGQLTFEQFALAMWMVERKKAGVDPPQSLAPNMIPPTLRDSGIAVDKPIEVKAEPQPTYSNPELEMISKEIDELVKERMVLEMEVAQREIDIRSKNGEVSSLQNELDTLIVTQKQLEQQKTDAEKRLEELNAQVCISVCFYRFSLNVG